MSIVPAAVTERGFDEEFVLKKAKGGEKNLHIALCSSCSNDSCLIHWQAKSTGSSQTAKIPEEQSWSLVYHISDDSQVPSNIHSKNITTFLVVIFFKLFS